VNVSQAVARVYAEALLDMAEAGESDLGKIVDDLRAVQNVSEVAQDFGRFFSSPKLDVGHKKQIINELFEGKIGREVMGLIHVLIDKRREPVFNNIVAEFERYKDIREGRIHAYATVARELEEDQLGHLTRSLEEISGKKVVVHQKVDPRVIGGLIVKMGDHIIDGSLRRRLDRLRRGMVAAQG